MTNVAHALPKIFESTNYATNGQNGLYTTTEESNTKKIKIYSPTNSSSKIFLGSSK